MILVRIRCHNCRRVLKQVETPPSSWDGNLEFLRCKKCDLPGVDRIVDVLISTGRDAFLMAGTIPWVELRPLIRRAQKCGRAQDLNVRVVDDRGEPV